MLNLIRMNLFRMVHTKSVIVVFIVLMLFANISSCLTLTAGESIEMAKEMKEGQVEFYEPDAASGDFGIYINTPVKSDGTLKEYVYVYFSISSGLLLLFILIGAVLFFRGDEKNGFIKNIAGQTKHKHNIMLSKLVAVGIYTFVCMFCYMLIGYLTFVTEIALVEGGISFGIKYLPEAIKIFALQYLLYMAFISGLLLITEVTKSTAAGITAGSFGIMGFGMLFVTISQKVFNTDFDISKYYISTNISKVNMDAGADIIKFALGIGIVYFIIYNVLNFLWFLKRDVV